MLFTPRKGQITRNQVFEPQTAKISHCVTCAGVLESKKVTGGGVKNRHRYYNFTYMHSCPLESRNTKVCMSGEVPDIITPFKFDVDWFRGFQSLRVYMSGCSIDKASRPYNSSALPCRLWLGEKPRLQSDLLWMACTGIADGQNQTMMRLLRNLNCVNDSIPLWCDSVHPVCNLIYPIPNF